MPLPAAFLALSLSSAVACAGAGDVSAASPARATSARTVEIVDGELRVLTASVEPAATALRIEGGRLVVDAPEVDVPAPRREQALELVQRAVAQGAPLFNAGLPEGCVAVYDVALRGVLLLDDDLVSDGLRADLELKLAGALASHDPVDAAWLLREGLDSVVLALADDSGPRPRFDERLVMDLGADTRWSSVNDDVMGGLSRGSLRGTERGTAVYSGQLSLENNGGFSTVRSPARDDLDLAGWDGLLLRVRGDGRRYSVQALRSDRRGAGHYWNFEFDTVADEWIEVRVPFDEMLHTIMGWELGDSVDPASVRTLAFMIADKDTRPFALEIDWIRAWRQR